MAIRKAQTAKNRPKPANVVFASYPKKKVDRRYIDVFWEKYFNGSLKKAISRRKDVGIISQNRKEVKIFTLSPTVAVTVRSVSSKIGKQYLDKHKIINMKIKIHKLKRSEIFLADVIDYKIIDGNCYIIERIIPSISVKDIFMYDYSRNKIKDYENRYQNQFSRTISKMNKKSLNKMLTDLDKALKELRESPLLWSDNNEPIIDHNAGNTIIIDYNPKIGKFKFGFIDLIGTNSKSF